MSTCFGITRNLHRCRRERPANSLFCLEHRRQPLAWLAFFTFTIGGAVASFLALVETGGILQSPKPLNRSGPLFDIQKGKLGYPIDSGLTIEAIQYECQDQNEIEPLRVHQIPVEYDQRQHNWRVRTNRLLQTHATSLFMEVPQTIEVSISGYSLDEVVRLHILTDDLYTHKLNSAEMSGGQVTINIGSPGFTGFLNKVSPPEPRLVLRGRRNLTKVARGPIALLVASAENTTTRRSLPIGVVRSGFRFPDDYWILNDKPQFVFVNDLLPPLIVFQSRRQCSPRLQGIFASTIDGSEVWELSPPHGQHALGRVDSGPPGRVYFLSNFETQSDLLCYVSVLNRKPIKAAVKVDESLCR